MFFVTYLISYFLTYFGFFLGNATKEEHKEIEKYVKYFIEILTIITYLVIAYFFHNVLVAPVIVAILIIMKVSSRFTSSILEELHNVFLFGVTFFLFYTLGEFENIYFTLLPLLILVFENSFLKFSLKEEGYKLVFALIIFILLKSFI